jgi:hypothetical protein
VVVFFFFISEWVAAAVARGRGPGARAPQQQLGR